MSTAAPQLLCLPFQGRWFVGQGGDTLNVNHHMNFRPQWFGIDFVKVGGPSNRELALAKPAQVEDFFSWGQPILAPHAGVVVTVVGNLADNALGCTNTSEPAGNFVCIRFAEHRFLFLAHFQHGSIVVNEGELVAAGQVLGKCGNSGNTSLPHLHLHIQDSPELNTGEGQMPVFEGIHVELSGKQFQKVTWPLTRGLFVSPAEA